MSRQNGERTCEGRDVDVVDDIVSVAWSSERHASRFHKRIKIRVPPLPCSAVGPRIHVAYDALQILPILDEVNATLHPTHDSIGEFRKRINAADIVEPIPVFLGSTSDSV